MISSPLKRRRRRLRKAGAADETAATEPGTQRPAVPAQATASSNGNSNSNGTKALAKPKSAKSPEPDDDMREIEEILRRRGIN